MAGRVDLAPDVLAVRSPGTVVGVAATDTLILLIGGFFAGVINSMAGGGSMLTVPLLSLAGVGGNVANGTNRVAVFVQNLSSAYGYARRGVIEKAETIRVLMPVLAGGLVGSLAVVQVPDRLFEQIFGVIMLPLLVLSIRKPKADTTSAPWPPWLSFIVFFGVGFYGGAVQAGVGLLFLLVLARAGFDLVTANAMKTALILGITAIALPVFIYHGHVRWLAAFILSVGMGVGGFVGANLAVDGGERLIRPVMIVVVLALASRMLGLWDLVI